MATLDHPSSLSQVLAAERFKLATELAIEGKSPYPKGAAFVAADRPDLGVWLADYARRASPRGAGLRRR